MDRILKTRYFKHKDIMDAKMVFNSSYIWQSITWIRDLIVKGLLWRVGDGRNIYVSKDAWIPGFSSGRSSVINNSLIDFKVAHFISQDGSRNEETYTIISLFLRLEKF